MTSWIKTLLALALGAVAGVAGSSWFTGLAPDGADSTGPAREPLYWVAPMDSNYRRDKPGKSPMGMDLIPVFADDEGSAHREAGTVEVSPQVVNSLGVRSATVERGRLPTRIRSVGYVRYDEDRLVHISPRVEGWLETLHVKTAGDPVTRGEPLYTLYSPTLVNAQEEMLLALERDNRSLLKAAVDRMSALEVPEASIQRLLETRTVTRTITITAPQSGVVDTLTLREGMYVEAGSMVMSIAQLEHLWVIGEIFEREAGLIRVGDEVTVTLDYLPGVSRTGRVDYVYPTLDEETRTVRIRSRVANPDGILKPGMYAQLSIEATPGDPALLIPREALLRTGGQPRVVIDLGEGRFQSREVTPGRIGDRRVEIRSGIEEGERIVTSAQFLIDSESSKTADLQRMAPAAPESGESAPNADHSGHAPTEHGSTGKGAPVDGDMSHRHAHEDHRDD